MENLKVNNPILDLSLQFALEIIDYCERLEANRKYIVSGQLLKSGTSIGANVREAQQAESRMDFIHKLKISLKELEETEYWLLLCKYSKSYPDPGLLSAKLLQIRKLLVSIMVSARKNIKASR